MEKQDNFADNAKIFLNKNKRYIGAAALFIAFVLVLVNCTGPKQKVADTQSGTESSSTQPATEYEINGKFEKNASQELVDLITNYYNAYASGDTETMEGFVSPFSDYEKYENITCYSLPGATEDSYLVSAVFDLKFYEVDTPAPGMDFFYVERDGKGNLYINNVYSAFNFTFLEDELDANLYSLVLSYEKSDEVKALQTKYDEAVASDDKLANMVGGTLRTVISNWRDTIAASKTDDTQAGTESTDSTQLEDTQKADSTENSEQTDTKQDAVKTKDDTKTDDSSKDDSSKKETKKTGKVKTKDICNVRAKASTDAEVLGKVDVGVKLKKLGTSGEWTKVKFQGQTGYIKSDLLKEVK